MAQCDFSGVCSESLPVNMVETEGVEEFLANAAHTKLTAVPQGNLIVCGYRTWYDQTSVPDPD
jgi:hypothetical protein